MFAIFLFANAGDHQKKSNCYRSADTCADGCARCAALFILAAAIIFVAISYYRLRNNKPFRLRSETPELSKEITGIIEGYEQRVMKDNRLYLHLKATRDITFSDGHHELEQVDLSVYPAGR